MKGWKIFHANGNKEYKVTIFIVKSIAFKSKTVKWDKEEHHVVIKRPIHQDDKIIITINAHIRIFIYYTYIHLYIYILHILYTKQILKTCKKK